MWAARDQLIANVPNAAEAVRMAMHAPKFPVTLMELGDNIGGGSAGDATIILQELLAQQAEGWVVALYDPEAVQQCFQAGIGTTIGLRVGGKLDRQHGPTLAISGRVRTLSDGHFIETERRHGGQTVFHQGLTAVVSVPRRNGTPGGLLLLNSERMAPMSIHQLTSAGIVPQQQKILVAKGAVAPRAAYEPVSAQIITVDTAGATAISIPSAQYHYARHDLYEWTQ